MSTHRNHEFAFASLALTSQLRPGGLHSDPLLAPAARLRLLARWELRQPPLLSSTLYSPIFALRALFANCTREALQVLPK